MLTTKESVHCRNSDNEAKKDWSYHYEKSASNMKLVRIFDSTEMRGTPYFTVAFYRPAQPGARPERKRTTFTGPGAKEKAEQSDKGAE